MAPLLQQSVAVLQLPLTELAQAIDHELQNNPLLEIEENSPLPSPEINDAELKAFALRQSEKLKLQKQEYLSDDEKWEEKPLTKKLSLEENLLEQLKFELNDPLQLKIGEAIIGNLNEDGFLNISCEEIAESLCPEQLNLVKHVLEVIQHFEPIGIAARDLKESLLIQVRVRFSGHHDLATRIITECFDELCRKKFSDIARKLGVNIDSVKEAAQKIANLEPKPARNFRPLSANIYIKPDVIIKKDPLQGYSVSVCRDGIPQLRVNMTYQRMLENKNLKSDEREFIKEKIKDAINFIKSVDQRGNTIQQIALYILEKQKDFFEGTATAIIPMTLKDVAEAINRNESTISRAIQGKFVESPLGTVALKYFFSQALSDGNNETVSSRGIKEEIKDLIDAENKHSPLSDQEIQDCFTQKGMPIARRTISKYRQQLNILPSHLRKE